MYGDPARVPVFTWAHGQGSCQYVRDASTGKGIGKYRFFSVISFSISSIYAVAWFPGNNEPDKMILWDPDESEMTLGQSYPRPDLNGFNRYYHASAKYNDEAILFASGVYLSLTTIRIFTNVKKYSYQCI